MPWRSSMLAAVALALGGACGTLAPDPGETGPLPHGGTGELEPLSALEGAQAGTPAGRVLNTRGVGFDSASVTDDGVLFYAAALVPDMAAEPDPTLPPGDVDFSVLDGRRIYRAPPREEGYGYDFPGTEVLSASESWEGGEVYTPWVLVLADGRARLYYASSGGIGVAEAPSVEGAFTRAGTGPVVPAEGALAPRRPSVVPSPTGEGFLMFYELDDHIVLARSDDGLAFTTVADPLELGAFPLREGEAAEISAGGPGAVLVETATGRRLVRLYHESRRGDGTRVLMMSATEDGERFERFERPVSRVDDRRDPAPRILDLRTTLVYASAPRDERDRPVRTLVGTKTPRDAVLVEEAPAEPMM
jgi:hypothetical protein